MTEEAEVFAGVTEATTSDVEASGLRDNARDDEDRNEHSQNQQAAAIQQAENHGQTAKNFQPRQIEGEPHANRSWQNFVIINVVSKAIRIHGFEDAGINENAADDKSDDAPRERFNHLTI